MYLQTGRNLRYKHKRQPMGGGGSICSRDPAILLMSKPHGTRTALTRTRFSQLSDLFHAVPRHATVIIRDANATPPHLPLFQRWNIIVGITGRYC